MKIAMLMPVHRPDNWALVQENMWAMRWEDIHIQFDWKPLLYQDEFDALTDAQRKLIHGNWEKTVIIPRPENLTSRAAIIYTLINSAMDALSREDFDGWMILGSDDDLVPHRYLTKIREAHETGAKALVVGLERGQRIGASGYDVTPLGASAENMTPGAVNGSQVAVDFQSVKDDRFEHQEIADGLMIKKWHERMPDRFKFVPYFKLPFNALEPGRWDYLPLHRLLHNQ